MEFCLERKTTSVDGRSRINSGKGSRPEVGLIENGSVHRDTWTCLLIERRTYTHACGLSVVEK